MGGHALKDIKCTRVLKEKYLLIKNDVINKIKDKLKYEEVIETPNKKDFGDLDLLIQTTPNLFNIIKETFNPKSHFVNGNAISFSYQLDNDEYFQIDFIQVDNLKIAQFYFSYGDLGGILGRMVHPFNMRLGFNGLFVNYEYENIIICNEPKLICDYLTLNYEKWSFGFNNITEIYEWIVESNFFDKSYFIKLNSKARMQEKSRPMYLDFITFTETIEKDKVEPIDDIMVHIKFFNKMKEIEEIDKQIKIRKIRQEKFSGLIFQKYVDKKLINKKKEEFKEYIQTNHNFDEWLDETNIDCIENEIKNFVLNYIN